MNAFQELTSDKHGSAARRLPCAVLQQAGVGPSILRQALLHHEARLPPVQGGLPEESHFT